VSREPHAKRAQRERNAAAINHLDSLINAGEEDSEDQRETVEILMRTFGEQLSAKEDNVMLASRPDRAATAIEPSEEEILEEQARNLDALVEALMNVSDEEAEEQRETWEYLRQALNEDRLSDRKRVP
jgi:hypothetical protein